MFSKILIPFSLGTVLLLSACGGSEKGNWTDEDKNQFRAQSEITPEMQQVKSLLGPEKYSAFVECAINKAEAKYDSLAVADTDEEGMGKIGEECALEVMKDPNSKKGAWSVGDKGSLRAELETQRSQLESTFGKEGTDRFNDCAIKAAENAYASFFDANQDLPGMEKIGEKCGYEVMKSK